MNRQTRAAAPTQGELVRRYRERMGATQQELAVRARLSVRTLRDIEHDRIASPRKASMQRLTGALALSDAERVALLATAAGQERGAEVSVAVLGPVRLRRAGALVPIGSAKLRDLLALLALHAGRGVGDEHIVDVLWDEHPPRHCGRLVQIYAGQLRILLEPTRPVRSPARIVRRVPGGYLLDPDTGTLDLRVFDELVAEAGQLRDSDAACGLLGRALANWRGPLAADASARVRQDPAAVTVSQCRLAAALRHADLALELGRCADVVGQLRGLAAEEPLHEGVAARLMQSLAAGGEQSAALAVFHDIRTRLDEQLGITPGAELTAAHLRVLRHQLPPTSRGPAPPDILVPRQLPAGTGHFTGREKQLANLHALLDRDVPVVSITGAAGVGKTALAVHWAHAVANRFPDGQLHLNLRGFDPVGTPMSPAEAIRMLLDALEVPVSRIPKELDAQLALYRSQLAGKRALVVLDNARDAEQVSPLLPGGPGCVTVVTSRNQLTSLVAVHGAHRVALDLLSVPEARELLARRLGVGRVATEPEAVDEIIAGCARLPLALAIAAARAAAHADFPLAILAREIRAVPSPLDALDTGDLTASVRTVFGCSHRALTAAAADLFGLLGRAPGPDIGVPAAAALAAQPAAATLVLLRDLESVHLVEQHVPGRYRMHDLVRCYAVERARAEPEPLRRLVDHYLHTALAANRLLAPHNAPISLGEPVTGGHPHHLDDEAAALAWLDTERRCLLDTQHLAAQQGWHTVVWRLAWALDTFHHRRGLLDDHLTTWQAGLNATERLDDPATRALAHRHLGNACSRAGRPAAALDHLRHALGFAEQTDDVAAQADTHYRLGSVLATLGDDEPALEHATHSLRLTQTLGSPVQEARRLNAVGWMHARLKRYQPARAHCEQALSLHRQHDDREGEAVTLDSLGYIAHHTHRHDQALAYYGAALTLLRNLGNTYEEADTLVRLGETRHAMGRTGDARDAWQQAVTLYEAQHRTDDADRIRRQLAQLGIMPQSAPHQSPL